MTLRDTRGHERERREVERASYDDHQLGAPLPLAPCPTCGAIHPITLDPGLPPLDATDPVARLGHPFKCRVFGCLRLVAWMDVPERPGVGVGYCAAHAPRAATIPVGIFGREREGWNIWPEPLARYLLRRGRRDAAPVSGATPPSCAASSASSSPASDSTSTSPAAATSEPAGTSSSRGISEPSSPTRAPSRAERT